MILAPCKYYPILKIDFFCFPEYNKMVTRKMKHYTTLSSNSKMTLQSGNLTKMILQFRKLRQLCKQATPITKGPLHRHVKALKDGISQHTKLLGRLLESAKNTEFHSNFPHCDNLKEPLINLDNDTDNSSKCENMYSGRDTLNKRWMRHRKSQQINTRRKGRADDSLKQEIYKHYYHKLGKLTKMTVDPVGPSYTSRANARSTGIPTTYKPLSFEEKFRILLYNVNIRWKPRDYIQRKWDYRSLFSRLCASIMDCIKKCTSNEKGDRLDSMDRLDNLFGFLRRFKIPCPIFRTKRVLTGGGPKKRLKTDGPKCDNWGKRNVIGNDQLSVPVIDSLSGILKKQFKLKCGLLNVEDLYRASRVSGQVSQRMKRYNLNAVPVGLHTVQIHFCNDHYVTSEQRPSGIVVWDSIQTSESFMMELYPQLQLTYDMLSQYNNPPKGLLTYKTDNNMQEDYNSCGIFAMLRAYSILSGESHKINTIIGRSYLTYVLQNGIFTSYSMFARSYSKQKMDDMMENYMSNQNELQSKRTENVTLGSNELNLTSGVCGPVRKRGRPAKYSPTEKKQKIKESKLRSYHKTKGIVKNNGRPAKYSPKEKDTKIRESKLRSYHKRKQSHSTHEKQKHSKQMKLLRSDVVYREMERNNDRKARQERRKEDKYRANEKDRDREWHTDRRHDHAFRESERTREREWHRDRRQHEAFREVPVYTCKSTIDSKGPSIIVHFFLYNNPYHNSFTPSPSPYDSEKC